jgi:hypothetical protein
VTSRPDVTIAELRAWFAGDTQGFGKYRVDEQDAGRA